MHAAFSFHFILLDLIVLDLQICEGKNVRNFSVWRFILRKLGVVYERLPSKTNSSKEIARDPNFQ
jgi:hypothetical protein